MKTIFFLVVSIISSLFALAKGPKQNLNTEAIRQTGIMQASFSTDEIITGYLKIKNALVKSDTKTAALSAESLEKTLNAVKDSQLTEVQKTLWTKIAEEAKKQTKMIVTNNGKLAKQRKAFQELSLSINDLVAALGTTQKLYQDFCPMYEGGSIWLSETKDIKNPYYGAQMLTCGKIKETFE